MNDEKQQAAIGRIVEDYAACKKKLEALESEARMQGNMLFEVGAALRTADRGGLGGVQDSIDDDAVPRLARSRREALSVYACSDAVKS